MGSPEIVTSLQARWKLSPSEVDALLAAYMDEYGDDGGDAVLIAEGFEDYLRSEVYDKVAPDLHATMESLRRKGWEF